MSKSRLGGHFGNRIFVLRLSTVVGTANTFCFSKQSTYRVREKICFGPTYFRTEDRRSSRNIYFTKIYSNQIPFTIVDLTLFDVRMCLGDLPLFNAFETYYVYEINLSASRSCIYSLWATIEHNFSLLFRCVVTIMTNGEFPGKSREMG